MKKLGLICFILLFQSVTLLHSQTASQYYHQASKHEDSNPSLADSLLQLSIRQAQVEEDFHLLAKGFYMAATIQAKLQQQDKAELYFSEAIQAASQNQLKKLEAKFLLRQGFYYLNRGQFSSAVTSALASTEIASTLKNDTLQADAFIALAEMYRQYDQYELAIEYNKKAMELGRRLKHEIFLAKTYNNLSATLGEIDRNQEAIDSLQKGLLLISPDNLFARAKFNSNIGFCYRNMGEFDKAIHFHKIALSIKQRANMDKTLAYSLGAIGRAYQGKNMIDSAIHYIQQEYNLARQYKIPNAIADAAQHLSEAHEASGNHKQALELLKENRVIEDSIYKAEDEINALNTQRKFDLSQKQQEVTELKNKQKVQKVRNQVYVSIVIALIIISVLLVLLFRAKIRQKSEENKRIELELENSLLIIEKDKSELQAISKNINQKDKSIQNLTSQLEKTSDELSALQGSKTTILQQLNETKILTNDDWLSFKLLFEKIHPQFLNNANSFDFTFTRGEKLLMALIKLDMTNKEIGKTLGISPESVSKSKFRLKRKLDNHQFTMGVKEFVHQL